SIADIDAGTGSVQVTLTVTHGTLTLGNTANLSFLTGTGTADATMTFTGTVADVNTALTNLRFTPAAGYRGPAALAIATDDLGNTGAGGPLTDADTVLLDITPINDAPTLALPGLQTFREDTARVF